MQRTVASFGNGKQAAVAILQCLSVCQAACKESGTNFLCCRDTVIASNPLAPTPANATGGARNAADVPSVNAGVPLLPMRLKPAVNASWEDIDTPNRATCEVSWRSLHAPL